MDLKRRIIYQEWNKIVLISRIAKFNMAQEIFKGKQKF